LSLAYLALLLIAAVTLYGVLRSGVAILLNRTTCRVEGRAAEWYASTWLGIWHPLDEAINMIAGSLAPSPKIAPRFERGSLLHWIPLLAAVYDAVFARAADEFAWRQIVRRIQGNDMVGAHVVALDRCPAAFEFAWPALPGMVADEIEAAANQASFATVARLRAVLEVAYESRSTNVILNAATQSVTFQELVHTSYFDSMGVRQILLQWISLSELATFGLIDATGITYQRGDKRTLGAERLPPRGSPSKRLDAVVALSFILVAALIGVVALSLYDATVSPLTDRYQVDQIAKAMRSPILTSVGGELALAGVLVRLEAIRYIPTAESLLNGVGDTVSRLRAAQEIAHQIGRTGEFDRLSALALRLSDIHGVSSQILDVQTAAVVGAVETGRTPPLDVISDLRGEFVRPASGPAIRSVIDGVFAYYGKGPHSREMLKGLIQERFQNPNPVAPIVPSSKDMSDNCFAALSAASSKFLRAEDRMYVVHLLDCRATALQKQIVYNAVLGTELAEISKLEILNTDAAPPSSDAVLLSYPSSNEDDPPAMIAERIVRLVALEESQGRFQFARLHGAIEQLSNGQEWRLAFLLDVVCRMADQLRDLDDVADGDTLYREVAMKLPLLLTNDAAQTFKNELFDVFTADVFTRLARYYLLIGERDNATWLTKEIFTLLLDRADEDFDLRALWYARIADIAQSLGLKDLAERAIVAGMSVPDNSPDSTSVRGALDLVRTSRSLGPSAIALTAKALNRATDLFDRAPDNEKLARDCVELVSGWALIGNLPRARQIAEGAHEKRAVLVGYAAILDVVMMTSESVRVAAASFADGTRLSVSNMMIDWPTFHQR
jgi:hypothetical protein